MKQFRLLDFIKLHSLQSRFFKQLCESMDSKHNSLVAAPRNYIAAPRNYIAAPRN